jgi:hypothetical protein
MRGNHGHRAQRVPAGSAVVRACRREGDLPHDRAAEIGDQRHRQRAARAELVDEFRLVSLGVGLAEKGRGDEFADRGGVARAFAADRDVFVHRGGRATAP